MNYRFATSAILLALVVSLQGADSNSLRVAVGPFFATKQDFATVKLATALPDLLAVELSSSTQFQLIEREQTHVFMKELNLTASGAVESGSMLKLGKLLGADWLISGSFIGHEREPGVWIKVIDIRTGIVRDAKLIPYSTSDPNSTFKAMAEFVHKTKSVPSKEEFVAFGQIVDISARTNQASFGRHIQMLLEKFCHENGLGVVERDASGQLLQETELDKQGFTGQESKDKLARAKWFIDGTCEARTETLLFVSLRMHKVGFQPEKEPLMARPGPALDEQVVVAFKRGLARTNWVPLAQGKAAESDLHAEMAMRLAKEQEPLPPLQIPPGDPAWQQQEMMEQSIQRAKDNIWRIMQRLESTLLLNPNDLISKAMLGQGLFVNGEGADKERGQKILEELLQSDNKQAAQYAKDVFEYEKQRQSQPPQPTMAFYLQDGRSVQPLAPEEHKRIHFLQKNFDKLVPVTFQKPNGKFAVIQRFNPRENRVQHEGMYYSGISFTAPKGMGRDSLFVFMWLFDKGSAQKNPAPKDFHCYLIPRKRWLQLSKPALYEHPISKYKEVERQFPHTETFSTHYWHDPFLFPEETYSIWFAYKEPDLPDMAVAMTVENYSGNNEFGFIPYTP